MLTALRNTDRSIIEIDDSSKYVYSIAKPVVTVTIIDLETGLRANGSARCTPDDTWDEDFGMVLAVVRATKRLCGKSEKRLVKSTD